MFRQKINTWESAMADLPASLVFNPHWVIDPAIWRLIDQNDKAKVAAVAQISA